MAAETVVARVCLIYLNFRNYNGFSKDNGSKQEDKESEEEYKEIGEEGKESEEVSNESEEENKDCVEQDHSNENVTGNHKEDILLHNKEAHLNHQYFTLEKES